MSEIALVSSRKARLQRRAEKDDGARVALELANAPERFLSTVQIGITLIGILAGAFGGATITRHLAERLNRIPALAPYSEAVSFVVVVVTIAYLSLVVAHVAPTRPALTPPDRTASRAPKPMRFMSRLTSPAVHALSASSSFLLRLLGARPTEEPPITEEEVKILIDAGAEAGVFEAA